jgi:serine/threonine-protein kinase MRCK
MDSLTDSEETIIEIKRMHEREKLMLLQDNKKLMMDLDAVSSLCSINNSVYIIY